MSIEGRVRAVFVSGVPASGKSTLGRALAREFGAALLDLDTLTDPLYQLLGGDATRDPTVGDGRTGVNAVRYECLFDTARENLEVGRDVILVAPFTTERSFEDAWRSVVDRLRLGEGEAVLIWVDTPAAVVIDRMKARAEPRDRSQLQILDAVLSSRNLAPPVVPHLRVDGTAGAAEQVREVGEFLAR